MIRISDMLKNTSKKYLIDEEGLLKIIEILFEREGYYRYIQNRIDKGLVENKDEVMISFCIRTIKKQLRGYLKKNETFTEGQLVTVIKKWAVKQGETMKTKFEWRFERDSYDDLYFNIWIGFN